MGVPTITLLLVIIMSFGEYGADDGINLDLFKQSDYNIKFERAELVSYNKDIMEDVSIITSKYNRTIAIVNMTFTFKVEIDTSRAIVQSYKFMSNEYRTFPMHFAVNMCKAITADVAGLISGFKRCGNIIGCPFRKGIKYNTCNWYPDESKFPPSIPNGQYKNEIRVLHSSQEVLTMNQYFTVFRPIV